LTAEGPTGTLKIASTFGEVMSFDLRDHYQNRAKVPEAELSKHYGKHVAWNLEGTHIVASSRDPLEVCQAVLRAGLKSDDVVLSYLES
jgi:hypothetical protein